MKKCKNKVFLKLKNVFWKFILKKKLTKHNRIPSNWTYPITVILFFYSYVIITRRDFR